MEYTHPVSEQNPVDVDARLLGRSYRPGGPEVPSSVQGRSNQGGDNFHLATGNIGAPGKMVANEPKERKHLEATLHEKGRLASHIVTSPTIMEKNDSLPNLGMKILSHARNASSSRRGKVIKLTGEDTTRARVLDTSSITTPASTADSKTRFSRSSIRDNKSASARAAGQGKAEPSLLKPEKSKKKVKELITPLEYAKLLQAKLAEREAQGKRSTKPYLRGKKIFYCGGDMQYASSETRGRMDYIIRHGGTLVPVFDPAEVTHIVTDAHEKSLLRVLGLRKLGDIPEHIPTVKWSWVLSGFGRRNGVRPRQPKSADRSDEKGTTVWQDDESEDEVMDYELMHASFKERLDAGPSLWRKTDRGKHKENPLNLDHPTNRGNPSGSRGLGAAVNGDATSKLSRISEFTSDKLISRDSVVYADNTSLPSTPQIPRSPLDEKAKPNRQERSLGHVDGGEDVDSRICSDPLAEFYAQARAERYAELHDHSVDSDSDGEDSIQKAPPRASHKGEQKRGFLCDAKGAPERIQCINQDVIDKLEELMEIHKAKPSEEDHWRVFSYGKAIRALRSHPTRIRSFEEARTVRGVGDKTARKIMEILETGDLRRIAYERTDDVGAISILQGIYGVGRNIAHKWYANGCRTLDDVQARIGGITLTSAQETGLKYYDDINSRMPRNEAAEIFTMIKAVAALDIDPKLFIEIMGSYRRGKADCGDIDILITRPTDDGKTHHGNSVPACLHYLLTSLPQEYYDAFYGSCVDKALLQKIYVFRTHSMILK
ncbi:uncharacterized protein FIBRA_06250 [Fibroporia radiculosa]|uniref:DNA polymerase lambda n=1 Tax=Fibroporia radiculosa TaxID=599839 RepID=J4IB59_9APHY|nr:uncharacterized protein FIBRA_06250 [Fibroporia radiculosa]CCM04091.1 predicted protein [Fibroporia radiculosa]